MNIDMQNAFIAGLASGGLVEQREPFTGSAAAVVVDPIRGNSSATLSGFGVSDNITITISEAN